MNDCTVMKHDYSQHMQCVWEHFRFDSFAFDTGGRQRISIHADHAHVRLSAMHNALIKAADPPGCAIVDRLRVICPDMSLSSQHA